MRKREKEKTENQNKVFQIGKFQKTKTLKIKGF